MKTLKFKALSPLAKKPEYKTTGSAGADLYSCLTNEGEKITIKPFEIKAIPTGIVLELPANFEAQIRPRSGFALKGITIPNSPGTVDSDYRGELLVILQNLGKEDFIVEHAMRIAQVVISPVTQFAFEETGEISATERGSAGFGSTGVK
jgi:dUTP pyrophosphatase